MASVLHKTSEKYNDHMSNILLATKMSETWFMAYISYSKISNFDGIWKRHQHTSAWLHYEDETAAPYNYLWLIIFNFILQTARNSFKITWEQSLYKKWNRNIILFSIKLAKKKDFHIYKYKSSRWSSIKKMDTTQENFERNLHHIGYRIKFGGKTRVKGKYR